MNENWSTNSKQPLGAPATNNVHFLISQVQSFFDLLLHFEINLSSEQEVGF